ncbi:hypothetical protein BS17DRAFT_820530 [Gyrodon lividus]|nr:hypothetical protein BS17DRAFT_820530 [Gyrodon lividus]
MEDATAGKDGEVDMADSSSGEEAGQLEALLEEEDNSDYNCQTEDEDGRGGLMCCDVEQVGFEFVEPSWNL